MTWSATTDQQTVVDWFDAVYRRKGIRYLRPPEAYLIFPVLLGAQSHHRLLDVACGLGLLLEAAREHTSQLYGIDISPIAVEQAKRRVERARISLGSAESLPYETGTFDLITCLGSLERMLSLSRTLREMNRVGKPGARHCFLVRNSNTLAWKYLARVNARQRAHGHAGADSLAGWKALFDSHGFCVTDVLPDQYPLHRRRRLISLRTKPVDFRVPLALRGSIEHANEFVFILEKR